MTIALHFSRLKRHYENVVRTYDHVGFLDLANSSRIWTEIKQHVQVEVPDFARAPCFKSASPNKRVVRLAKGHRFVFSGMPEMVTTYAHKGRIAAAPDTAPADGDFTLGAEILLRPDGGLDFGGYNYISTGLPKEGMHYLGKDNVSRCNFAGWLGSEAARVSYRSNDGTLKREVFSLETIVKRLSNVYDGSHYSRAAVVNSENKYDEPLAYLQKHSVGGLPLPYYILLRFAQELIKNYEPFSTRSGSRATC